MRFEFDKYTHLEKEERVNVERSRRRRDTDDGEASWLSMYTASLQ